MLIHRRMALGAVAAVALVLCLSWADTASARKFSMSGTWLAQRGQVGIPLIFSYPITPMHNNLLYFPNGPITGGGTVTAMGASPASLTVPSGVFAGVYSAKVPLAGPYLVSITTMFTVMAPAASAMLAAGGGAGSFTFCPGNVATPGVPASTCPSTGPPQGAGTRNGRVIYNAGVNTFGGVMQMALGVGGEVRIPRPGFGFAAATFQVVHQGFGAAGGLQAPGGPYANVQYDVLASRPITQPLTKPTTMNSVMFPGPAITTGGGFTSCTNCGPLGTGPCVGTNLTACTTMGGATVPAGGELNINTGFQVTTGQILAAQSTGTSAGTDAFTRTGLDARTALGAGNITLISGQITLRTVAGVPYSSVETINMTMAPKTPSMSAGGFVAGAVLMVLAVGYALRRRF